MSDIRHRDENRWRGTPGKWFLWIAVGTCFLVAGARFVVSGALTYVGMPANVQGLEPLFRLLLDGQPIQELGPRTYGVVAFLLFDPIIRLFGRSAAAMNLWGLCLSLLALAVAFALVAIRLRVRRPLSLAVLGILWMGFLPIVYATALRHFDMLLLASVAATFFFYTGASERRGWSGVPAAAGFLTKFLTLILIPFLLIRERRAFIYGLATIVLSLLIGQIAYGTPIGLGYLYYVGAPTAGSIENFSTWHEGFSPRQLLFKAAAGFHLQNAYVAPPNPQLLSYVAYALEAAALIYLLYVVFRNRAADGLARRSVELALGVVTMYLVAPTVGHEHLVSMVIVYSILAWYWLSSPVPRPPMLIALAMASLFLTGVYVPMQVVGAAIPLDTLMRWLGNEDAPIFGNALGEYAFLGFPGYGVILAWVVLVVLERRTRVISVTTGRRAASAIATRA